MTEIEIHTGPVPGSRAESLVAVAGVRRLAMLGLGAASLAVLAMAFLANAPFVLA